jgi:hypothetical protein
MLILNICLENNVESSFYVYNVERVEVDCFKNFKIKFIDFFTEFRFWLNSESKDVSDNLKTFFSSSSKNSFQISTTEDCIKLVNSKNIYLPYSISIFSNEEDLICLKCMNDYSYKHANSLKYSYQIMENLQKGTILYGNLSVQGINLLELEHDGFFSVFIESRTAYLNTFPHDYQYTFEITKSSIKNSQGKYINANFFKDYPDQKNLNGAVYCLKMSDVNEIFYKIGITRKKNDFSLLQARKSFYKNSKYQIELAAWLPCSNFFDAWTLEQKLLSKYKKHYPKRYFEGFTECLMSLPEELKNNY